MSTKNIVIIVVAVVVIGLAVWLLGIGVVPSPRTTGPAGEEGIVTEQGTAVAPGTSPVTEGGQVVTQGGAPVKLDVQPGTPEAPQQSNPIEQAPAGSVDIKVSAAGFSPSSFEVRAGQALTIALTSTDTETHIFKFKSPSLSAAAIGVGPGETRALTFNAPSAGTYDFYCDVPGHEGRGEVGTMVVR